jgi:hypothetical protein
LLNFLELSQQLLNARNNNSWRVAVERRVYRRSLVFKDCWRHKLFLMCWSSDLLLFWLRLMLGPLLLLIRFVVPCIDQGIQILAFVLIIYVFSLWLFDRSILLFKVFLHLLLGHMYLHCLKHFLGPAHLVFWIMSQFAGILVELALVSRGKEFTVLF